MIRLHLFVVVVLNFFLFLGTGFAQDQEFYCYERFDKYRQIKYWAKVHVSINDYNYNSGDSSYLDLTYKVPDTRSREETNKIIVAHLNKEFERIIKGNLPFHNTDEGRDEWISELVNKYVKNNNFFDILRAQEEARRNSLYGPNPGALYCLIRIERHDFPVLYEMECSIIANKDLINRNGLEEKKLGYSSPELIVGELNNSITMQLEKLNTTLKRIRNCK